VESDRKNICFCVEAVNSRFEKTPTCRNRETNGKTGYGETY
jgi:hypothetical protein